MSGCDIVKNFLNELEAEDLPLEYIHAAKITDEFGKDLILKGDDLQKLLNHDPFYEKVSEARIFINIKKIMRAINIEVEYIYYRVEQMMAEEEANRSK